MAWKKMKTAIGFGSASLLLVGGITAIRLADQPSNNSPDVPGSFYNVRYENVPASEVLKYYQAVTKVKLVGETEAGKAKYGITLQTNRASKEQVAQLLEQGLSNQAGIFLTPIGGNRVSVTYNDQIELQHLGPIKPALFILTSKDVVAASVRLVTKSNSSVQNLNFNFVGKTEDEIRAIARQQPEIQITKDGILMVKSEKCARYGTMKKGKVSVTGLTLIFNRYEDAELAAKTLRGN